MLLHVSFIGPETERNKYSLIWFMDYNKEIFFFKNGLIWISFVFISENVLYKRGIPANDLLRFFITAVKQPKKQLRRGSYFVHSLNPPLPPLSEIMCSTFRTGSSLEFLFPLLWQLLSLKQLKKVGGRGMCVLSWCCTFWHTISGFVHLCREVIVSRAWASWLYCTHS